MSQPTFFRTEFTIENFFRKLKEEGRLSAEKCKRCGMTMIPPRQICAKCFGSDFEWIPLPETGTVLSFSEIHVSSDEFQKFVPYVISVASFGELKIPGMIKDKGNSLKVGSRVKIAVEPEGKPAYKFFLV